MLRDPKSKLELWFRKAPASFVEMVNTQESSDFWIVHPAPQLSEFGSDYPGTFGRAFFCLQDDYWLREHYVCQLGHADMIVSRGAFLTGVVLLNPSTVLIPFEDWGTRAWVLEPDLWMIPLGRIQ